jgi:hypothetical protein
VLPHTSASSRTQLLTRQLPYDPAVRYFHSTIPLITLLLLISNQETRQMLLQLCCPHLELRLCCLGLAAGGLAGLSLLADPLAQLLHPLRGVGS